MKAIVITGTKGKFSGGFDITQLKAMTEGKQSPKMNFNEVLNSVVESGPKPTVAGASKSPLIYPKPSDNLKVQFFRTLEHLCKADITPSPSRYTLQQLTASHSEVVWR